MTYYDDGNIAVASSNYSDAPIHVWLDDEFITIDEAETLIAALKLAIADMKK